MTTPKLQHELKKKRPFDSPLEEAALNLVRTSDQLQLQCARLFRQHGLTPSQYNIQGIPTLILFKDGKPIDWQVGLVPKDKLVSLLNSHTT